MKLELAKKYDYKAVKRIYNEAFPSYERAPFRVIKRRALNDSAQMFIAKRDEEIIGFAYIVCDGEAAYLFYFAVRADLRGCGIGTEILKLVKEAHSDKKLFLAREKLDEQSDNYEMRIKRRNFYIRNGFTDIPLTIKEGPVLFDVMSIDGDDITRDEYLSLMEKWGGVKVLNLVDMIYDN